MGSFKSIATVFIACLCAQALANEAAGQSFANEAADQALANDAAGQSLAGQPLASETAGQGLQPEAQEAASPQPEAQEAASPQPEAQEAASPQPLSSAGMRPLDIRRFHSLNRVGVPVVSPDNTLILFTVSRYSDSDNKLATYINVLNVNSGEMRRLTPDSSGLSFVNPVWIDAETFGYLHKGAFYIQALSPGANGTLVYEPAVPISNLQYLAEAGKIAFIASVLPEADLNRTKELKDERERKRIDSALIYNSLWVRRWNEWMLPEKPTLFVAPLNVSGIAGDSSFIYSVGKETNVMQALPVCRDPMIRWTVEDYAASPDGRHVAFVTRRPADKMVWGSNVDIYLASVAEDAPPKLLTDSSEGVASSPAFSSDGRMVAWLQMETPAYESDINRVYIHDVVTGETTSIARDWDLTPQSLLWSYDSRTLYSITGSKGHNLVYAIDIETGGRTPITLRGAAGALRRLGKSDLLILHSDEAKTGDLYQIAFESNEMRQLTDLNAENLRGVYLGEAEEFWFAGARGDPVHGWFIKPFGFDASKKYPLAYIVHGGPQQANIHTFSYAQWNPNMYASAGFVAALVNFHGSPTYGQNFTDSILREWGGYPYEDLMLGLEHLVKSYAYIDKTRMVALGASFGGYMMNWFNGHTKVFKALVSHDGMFSAPMFWYSTEELWFPEHDFGGVPFKRKPRQTYERWNPERFADNFTTPTLFIHGEKDYRLTVDNSLGPFTLLKRKGIPARFMFFPGEDHWTNHIGNSIRWYTEVFKWISKFTNHTLPYKLDPVQLLPSQGQM